MRLTDLDATFRRIVEIREEEYATHKAVEKIADAQGVMFLCPKCFVANGGKVGTHRVICWSRSRGVPDQVSPKPGRWSLVGTSLEDLTLDGDGGSRSVLLIGGCAWHGFITNGEISNA